MSETVRSYTGSAHGPAPRHRRFSRRGKITLALLLFAIFGCGLWATRDTYRIEDLVAADQTYQVLATDTFGIRDALAESKLVKALPPQAGLGDAAGVLAGDFGVPEWVLNNLAPNVCVVSGKDVQTFRDPLLITRMSHVGCLLMMAHGFLPGVECEAAGGLHLSRLRDAGVYFARRGRLLALSPSRDALIRALTLRSEDAVSHETMAGMIKEAGGGNLIGTFLLGPEDPLGTVFEKLRFAVHVEGASIRVKCSGALCPEWSVAHDGFFQDLAPAELMTPPEGMLRISMNLSKPIGDVWPIIAQLAGEGAEAEALWRQWSTPPQGTAPGPAQIALAFLGHLGPGLSLGWAGVDLNEMFPAPQLVAAFEANRDEVQTAFSALPPLAADATRYAMTPQYDAAAKCVRLPLIGGPSLEPTAGLIGDTLLVSSSRTIAETLLGAGITNEKLKQPGNLYVTMRPQACAEALVSLASVFAENDLLKGYSRESLQTAAAPWVACASAVKDVTALARCQGGGVELNLSIDGN